jgi:ribonucleoside-triphosphate reductase
MRPVIDRLLLTYRGLLIFMAVDAKPAFSQIRKRDGNLVQFDSRKITAALLAAGKVSGEFSTDIAKSLTNKVLSLMQVSVTDEVPSVEQVQDIVEEVLLATPFRATAKSYIIYREQHAQMREAVKKSDLALVDNYLERLDWKVRENSNMAYSLQGLNNYVASTVSETYWLNKIYPKRVKTAHVRGDLHIHDLSLLANYCSGWSLQDLLVSGFRGAAGKIESKPAKHLRAVLGQIVNFFYTIQGEVAGASAFSNFDTLLAPFVYYDDLSYEELKQAIQEFIFNINVPTRVGFQTPFTNLTFDLQPPEHLASQPVVIGGEYKDRCYGEFVKEMAMLNCAFLEVMAEGDACGRVFTFPIPTYSITEDFDWNNLELDKLWEVTAKYGIPYFANFVGSDMSPDDTRSMCCRLSLRIDQLERRGGGLFGANSLTGSLGVCTINMPRLGYLSESKEEFFVRLGKLMDIAKESLEIKRDVLEQFTSKKLYPYTCFYLRDTFRRFGKYWTNHFSTIGLVGMNEACINLLGSDISTEEGRLFAVEVLNFMRGKLTVYQEETGSLYNLEATPAEGTSYRLARLDKQLYPDIKFAYPESPEPFYTNSTQLPVDTTFDIFGVLDAQDELQTLYTGGSCLHVFLGEAEPDPQAVKKFVRSVCDNYRLPYFSITPSFSICPTHGYLDGEVDKCPTCEAATEVYSRVVGYLRPVSQWNNGKQAEFALRSHYTLQDVGRRVTHDMS